MAGWRPVRFAGWLRGWPLLLIVFGLVVLLLFVGRQQSAGTVAVPDGPTVIEITVGLREAVRGCLDPVIDPQGVVRFSCGDEIERGVVLIYPNGARRIIIVRPRDYSARGTVTPPMRRAATPTPWLHGS